MKISKLFSLAALALMITACSDQIEQVQQPRNTEGIPFTATISTEGHAATRLLAESGTSITATWASGEKVALIYTVSATTYVKEAEVTPQGDGTATISTTLDGSPTDDTDVTIVYPASAVDKSTKDVKPGLLTSQNGLLTGTGSISDKYDLRKTSTPAKLKIDGTTASLKGTVKLAQQVSILKLTLQSGGSSLSAKALAIKDASDNLLASATLATAGSVFYMAVPAMTSAKIIAANGANTYSYSKASVSISAGKYYQSTVSLTQDDYTDLSALESANTYMVTAAGKYKFNATIKGNGGLDPITGTTATPISKSSIAGVKVLWELNDYGKAIKYSSSAYDISYLDGYVYFSTPETFESGDAYVAIYDSSDEILWSWLIWATPEPGTVNVTTKASAVYQFMDRNLGAIGDGKYEAGFNYQWGRKDPFPGNRGSSYGGTYVYSPERMTSHSIYKNLMTVDYSVAHPTTYASSNTEYHWVVEADYRSNIWYSGTAKTIYDPCPQGWRVPTKDEMDHTESKNTGWLGAGFIGDCNTDFGYGNAGAGYYWTSTSESWNQVWGWYNDNRKLVQDNHQRNGFSIRPVKDPASPLTKKFSVSTTKQVAFAPGNLQKVNGVWQFASHQYDYFGESQTDTQKDLFRFNDYSSPSGGTTWYALSRPEWEYLLASRSVTNSLSAGARYTLATLGGTYKGMIVFPDVYNHPAGATVSGTPVYNATSNYTATITLADWIKMELAGAIFLPAAGYYSTQSSQYENIGIRGAYTSTTEFDATYNLGICFDASNVNLSDNSYKSSLLSVRLVCD